MTETTLVVVKMPAEDYFNRTEGPYALALELADKHGGRSSGGGTDFATGMSDLDIEVPTANADALLAILESAGLPGVRFDYDE